jgi:growth hormone-inducible transmembrane protein
VGSFEKNSYHISLNHSCNRNDKYLYMGGPLLAGVTVVALTSLAPMALPLGTRALAITESISLYGGLAVFGGFVLYEYVMSLNFPIMIADILDPSLDCSTQKILHHARLAERGVIARDPMKEAIGLELDMLNILYILSLSSASNLANCPHFFSVRIVQILTMQNNRRK